MNKGTFYNTSWSVLKKKSYNSILASTVLQELGLGLLILLSTMPMPKCQSSLSVWWICSLQEFHCTPLMAGHKTGFKMLFSTSSGKLIHWFMAWNWRESKLALSVIQHLTVKCCCWCKCILNLVKYNLIRSRSEGKKKPSTSFKTI